MKPEDQTFITKIKKLIPEEEQRTLMLATFLGMAGVLTEFVATNIDIDDLPIEVQYACANVAANMIAFISDGERGNIQDISGTDYEMSEQTQERIYRKMKWVVEELYKSIQENEKV